MGNLERLHKSLIYFILTIILVLVGGLFVNQWVNPEEPASDLIGVTEDLFDIDNELNADQSTNSYWYVYFETTIDGRPSIGNSIISSNVNYFDEFAVCKAIRSDADAADNIVLIKFMTRVSEKAYQEYNKKYHPNRD